MSSHEPDRSTGSGSVETGDEDGGRKEDESVQEEPDMADDPKISLEDGELEEGELDDEDDGALAGDEGGAELVGENVSETHNQLAGSGAPLIERSGKPLATTEIPQPKKKEIPSLFDLKTMKPKSLKRSADDTGNKPPYLKYIDHDRMNEDYYDEGMSSGAWPPPPYHMDNEDYESSGCDQEPEDEFSVEIQQMLNRSATASQNLYESGDKSPRGMYDSPSEDEEEEDDAEHPPPTKLSRIDEDDGCVNYGAITKSEKKMKKPMTTNGRMSNNDNENFLKKSKLLNSRPSKQNELGGVGLLETPLQEKRRLMDTPMDERPQCKFFLEGKCKKGSNCPFNHDMPRPKKQDVCRYFLSGRQCNKGKDCPFSHDIRGICGEEGDGMFENLVPKKKKALLGSPPLQSRMMQSKDRRKIPSLFDIQINAEGPNAKEILQSAARRSVMQSTNPKPGLLGVAPPMIAAGMIGSMNRMRFPLGRGGFFDDFNHGPLQPKPDNQPQIHSSIEEFGLEMTGSGPHNPPPDFMPLEMKENGVLQQMNCVNQNVELPGRTDGQSVEVAQNMSSDFGAMPNFKNSIPGSLAGSLPPHFMSLNNALTEPHMTFSISGNLKEQSAMPPPSLIQPPGLPLILPPQLNSLSQNMQNQLSVNEVGELAATAASPSADVTNEKPQIVGGVDVNNLPPMQRELYLRMFAQQKEAAFIPTDRTNSPQQKEKVVDENLTAPPSGSNGNTNTSSDLLKFLVPSQVTSQPQIPETICPVPPSSSGSSFNITQMLSAIRAGGNTNANQFGPAAAGNLGQSDVVFEVSGSSLRGSYRLEIVTLETSAITLPAFVDPKDPKYLSDPRVQKHKDDVVVQINSTRAPPSVAVQSDVPFQAQSNAQRRDPRLARKETTISKEEIVPPNQDVPHQTVQQNVAGGAMHQVGPTAMNSTLGNMPPCGVPLGNIQGAGLGNLNPNGLPLNNMHLGGMTDGVTQQNGMHIGGMSMQHNGLLMGNMQLGGMQVGGAPSTGMNVGGGMNVNAPGMQPGGVSGMLLGGRPPVGIPQGLLQLGMQLSGMQQNNPPMGLMQQRGPSLGGMNQGGGPFGGLLQGGLQSANVSQGGLQQNILPLGGMSMNIMQQRMNMPVGGGMQQQGGLLPQPSGGLLQQRGLLPPPFLVQNQMPSMNMFQRANSLLGTPMPLNLCPPSVLPNEMVQPESSTINNSAAEALQSKSSLPSSLFQMASAVTGDSVMPSTGFPNALLPNPSFPRPLLPLPSKNLQMFGESCLESSTRTAASPSRQTHQYESNSPNGSVPEAMQPPQSIKETIVNAEVSVSEANSDHTISCSGDSISKVDRNVNYRDDPQYRIKKARTKDDATENSLLSDNSSMPGSPQSSELDVESRRTFLRNRDKLEFRSPLADMGDSASSSLSFGYNQPPNKKYQQMAEEESNARRSSLPKTAKDKDGFKTKQRAPRHLHVAGTTQNEQTAVAPVFESLRPSQDISNSEIAPSVQSIKDMFKSIDPTASPFC